MKTFKTIVDEKEIEVLVRKPIQADVSEADKIYAETVATLISSDKNYLLKAELESYLAKKKLWTKEDEDNAKDIERRINENLEKLNKGGIKLSEGRAIALQTTELRIALLNLMSKRQSIDDVTVESQATEERFDYLIYSCTINNSTNTQFWNTFEEMKNSKLDNDVYRSAKEILISLIFGVSEQIEKSLPENKWLLKHNMINDNLILTHPKTGKFVDRNGNEIKKTEEVAKPSVEPEFIDDYEEVVVATVASVEELPKPV